tara:strand:+ start:2305 stop:2985 length:681 start_codon:yes stop_codon:yes gene_type:complete
MPITRKNVILTLDTECSGLADPVYDIGWVIHDKAGKVAVERQFFVREVITNPDRMIKAYFARKIFTDYIPMLDAQVARLTDWADIAAELADDMRTYEVNVISAYNLGFDVRAMRITNDLFGNVDKIVPQSVKILDLWQFSCEVLLNTPTYKEMARANGWVTPKGNIQTSAEMSYRFITGDTDFIEAHTALDDAQIETEIAARCFAKKRRIPYGVMNAHPWRIVNAA